MSKLNHYYEGHEAEYVRRINAGHVGWDKGGYDEFFMKPFVARSLDRSGLKRQGGRALDLGCGTGALSCQLAEANLDVTGLDISATAIGFAKAIAEKRDLRIDFAVADIVRDPLPTGQFDVTVDGHLLHCIVFEEERQRVLEKVRQSLNGGGEFWVETMLLENGQEPDPDWHMDERGMVWSRIDQGDQYVEAQCRDGNWWLPQRLIARSQEALLAEFLSAGLTAVEVECYAPLAPLTPGGFRARLVAADGAG